MGLIAWAFLALALYLALQAGLTLTAGHHALPSPAGITWTAVTAVVMFVLAAAKASTGKALGNPVLIAEGKVTLIYLTGFWRPPSWQGSFWTPLPGGGGLTPSPAWSSSTTPFASSGYPPASPLKGRSQGVPVRFCVQDDLAAGFQQSTFPEARSDRFMEVAPGDQITLAVHGDRQLRQRSEGRAENHLALLRHVEGGLVARAEQMVCCSYRATGQPTWVQILE